jgi:hypothetical protein
VWFSPPNIKILPYAVWDFYQKIILNLKEVLSKNPHPNCKVKAMLGYRHKKRDEDIP